MKKFELLKNTLTSSIFPWNYFVDFNKVITNTFEIKIQLNILNVLLWENEIEDKFLKIIEQYPETRKVLPILIAVRAFDKYILDKEAFEVFQVDELFNPLKWFKKENMLKFFNESWLKNIFQNKCISNLNDYVFWIEVWLDSNARKNRTWKIMESLVEKIISDFCANNPNFEFKNQAKSSYIKREWWVDVRTDKSSRIFDFAVFNKINKKLFLFEVNYYGVWGSKLKSVAWEFTWLYNFMIKQWFSFYWITDGLWWSTSLKPLEDAYNNMNWNIYNLEMLKDNILDKILLND